MFVRVLLAVLLLAMPALAQSPVRIRYAPGDGGPHRELVGPKIVLPGNRVALGLVLLRESGPVTVGWSEIRSFDIIPNDHNPTAAIVFRDGREEVVEVERGWLLPERGADSGIDLGQVWRLEVVR